MTCSLTKSDMPCRSISYFAADEDAAVDPRKRWCVSGYAHPKVQTVKTLCALKCDVNKTATEEDIAGGATEADPAA